MQEDAREMSMSKEAKQNAKAEYYERLLNIENECDCGGRHLDPNSFRPI